MTTPRPPGEPGPEEPLPAAEEALPAAEEALPAAEEALPAADDAGRAVVLSRDSPSSPLPEADPARVTASAEFAAPPPQHPTPPAGFRPGPDPRPPLPPPPQHGQPVGQVRRPYRRPLPPGRSSARFPAPPPQHWSSRAGRPAAPLPSGRPRGTGRPPGQAFGSPVPRGQPQPYGQAAPSGPVRSPSRSLHCYQPPEQFAHPQHAAGPSYGAQPLPVPPSPPWTGQARPLAGFRARVISFLIDLVAPLTIVVLLLVLGVAVGGSVPIVVFTVTGTLGLVAFVLWNSCYLQGITGQSIGRRVAGTKLVKIKTGAPVGFGTAVVRQLCHGVEFGIGYLWPLWDIQRQTFADKITATLVVRADR